MRMCITEYNEERTLDQKFEEGIEIGKGIGRKEGKKEGIEEGRKEGIEEGRKEGIEIGEKKGLIKGTLKTLAELVKDGILPLTEAAKRADMSISEFEEMAELNA